MAAAERVVFALGMVVRRLMPARWRRRARLLMFRWLDQSWRLPTGVRVRVESYGDWIVFNEVFVNGDYDGAIAKALELADADRFRVLDLGANVGFFSLRVVDQARRRGYRGALALTLVEGHPDIVNELRTRLTVDNTLPIELHIVHGLVGPRSGFAVLHDDQSIVHHTDRAGPLVPFVDLTAPPLSQDRIDLLKCDIEGAELMFIQHYRDLLQRTRVAVFELHDIWCDTAACRRLLDEAGFSQHATFRVSEHDHIYCVWR